MQTLRDRVVEPAEEELRFSLGGFLVAGIYLALWLVVVAAAFALL